MAPARRSTKWVAPVLAASGAIALGVALWRWTSQKDRPDTLARSKRKGANPTLSLSFPVDPAWTQQLASMPAIHEMIQALTRDYLVHVLLDAPDGHAPSSVPCDRVLLYSTAAGRAMLARALQCQCHVEFVFVDAQGHAAWDTNDDIPAYLTRLDQLAQAVDALLVIVVRGPPAPHTVSWATLAQAWASHPVSQRATTQWIDLSMSAWSHVTERLQLQRQAWT